MTDTCIFIQRQKGKWFVNKHLKPHGAIYNGAGWLIEEKHRLAADMICKEAGLRSIPWSMDGHSFEEIRAINKESFYHVRVAQLNQEIEKLSIKLKIDPLDSDALKQKKEKLEGTPEGKELLEAIEEREHFENNIATVEIEKKLSDQPTIMSMEDRIKHLDSTLEKTRGKDYLGLKVTSIPEINECLLGLRKLILLAAAPGVGKTALTIQLAIEALQQQEEACLVYVSLEMTAEEIFTRMNLHLSGIPYRKYVLGGKKATSESGEQIFFDEDEGQKIASATATLKEIGERLQIVDSSTMGSVSSETINGYVELIKKETKCTRAIVVIDYLQVWPTPTGQKFMSEIEADKWRVGEMKKIRDKLNEDTQNPIIVISEARKPGGSDDAWGSGMADVMGTSRCTYTPDVVMLFSAPRPEALAKLWKAKHLPDIKDRTLEETDYEEESTSKNGIEESKRGGILVEALAQNGMAICRIKACKCRDGMDRFNSTLVFRFKNNTFTPLEKEIEGIIKLLKEKGHI
jgi:replicative DNA helicase